MKKWWKIVFLLPVVFAVLYGGGYIAQFIRNYKEWELAGSTGSPVFPTFDFAACFTALTTMPYGLMGVVLCIVLLVLLVFSVMHMGRTKAKPVTGNAIFPTPAKEPTELPDS